MIDEDVAVFLAAKGLGVVNVNIAREVRPAPDDLLVVQAYAGRPPEYVKSGPPVLRRPRFQLRARSKDPRAALSRLQAAARFLSGFGGLMNGTAYASIRELNEPVSLGKDGTGRQEYTQNFEATR